jgi:NAD(P)-dependent dehydrogenase (short-subunit alcohol dehydrogenase family)
MKNPMDMTGKRVLVTGAGSGIGRATAILLSELGASLVLVGRDPEKLRVTAQRLATQNVAIEPFDLSKTEEIVEWMQNLAARHGHLHGLVHSAGIQTFNPLRTITVKAFERLLTSNTVSSAMLVKAMQSRDCGADTASIVMIASTAGILGSPGNGAYGASKAAIILMVRTFALELVERGVRLNAVAPAMVETEMVQRSRDSTTPEVFKAMVEKHPMGIGQPDDVANAVAFLLSSASRWITGTTLIVDGGLSLP